MDHHATSLRALARLLGYPDDELIGLLPALADALARDESLSAMTRLALADFISQLLVDDELDLQAAYVDTFDRGRRTSLHLFEHVHGDSRDRGQAMVDLKATYAAAGLDLTDSELPDFLPVVLEFASTQPSETAREFLGEMAHVLNALHSALAERESAYAAPVAAVLELAGEPVRRVALAADEPLDASWAEPEAFGGCSVKGQGGAGRPQPIHIVRPGAATA